MMVRLALACIMACMLATASPPALAQSAPARGFDPVAATDAYLARMTPEQKARSDAYFEGKYWLLLWDLLAGFAVAALLLETRVAARMRDFAERLSRRKPLQTALFTVAYLVIAGLLLLPLGVYQDFYREHAYGLSNLSLGGWLKEHLTGEAVGVVLYTPLIMAVYGAIRRRPETWQRWAVGFIALFIMLEALIFPVFIAPLFNKYEPLAEGPTRAGILSMARANGMPATEVYEFDASKQSKRVSANVSGFLGTLRISLNDNLLQRLPPPGVKAVMGHELGHYVLNHAYKHTVSFTLIYGLGFVFLSWALRRVLAWRGGRWGVRDPGDVAGLPLLVLIFSFWLFLMTPVRNTVIRTAETEADIFGLNAAGEPDGFAEAAMLLSEYRKMEPGAVEEFVFFDHPSGRNRIFASMRWKAEHMNGEAK